MWGHSAKLWGLLCMGGTVMPRVHPCLPLKSCLPSSLSHTSRRNVFQQCPCSGESLCWVITLLNFRHQRPQSVASLTSYYKWAFTGMLARLLPAHTGLGLEKSMRLLESLSIHHSTPHSFCLLDESKPIISSVHKKHPFMPSLWIRLHTNLFSLLEHTFPFIFIIGEGNSSLNLELSQCRD